MQGVNELPLEIVERIAEREGIDPIELHPPLYESVDTDALESLTDSSTDERLQITFSYQGYLVRVDGAGTVQISRLRSDAVTTKVDV